MGLSETGIGVAKSLSQSGVDVYGISHYNEIGHYSSYFSKTFIAPHPISNVDLFKSELINISHQLNSKPVIFIAADEYLFFYKKNSKYVKNNFLSNLPTPDLTDSL